MIRKPPSTGKIEALSTAAETEKIREWPHWYQFGLWSAIAGLPFALLGLLAFLLYGPVGLPTVSSIGDPYGTRSRTAVGPYTTVETGDEALFVLGRNSLLAYNPLSYIWHTHDRTNSPETFPFDAHDMAYLPSTRELYLLQNRENVFSCPADRYQLDTGGTARLFSVGAPWNDFRSDVKTTTTAILDEGLIYAGVYGNGVGLYQSEEHAWKPFPVPTQHKGVRDLSICEGLVWTATDSGVYVADKTTAESAPDEFQLEMFDLSRLKVTSRSSAVALTNNHGLHVFDGQWKGPFLGGVPFEGVSDENVSASILVGKELLVAATSVGIGVYDTQTRRWIQQIACSDIPLEPEVVVREFVASGSTLVARTSSGLLFLDRSAIAWSVERVDTVSVADVVALDEGRQVYYATDTGALKYLKREGLSAPVLLISDARIDLPEPEDAASPMIGDALPFGDSVFLGLRQNGILLYRYSDHNLQWFPSFLGDSGSASEPIAGVTEFSTFEERVYALAGGVVLEYVAGDNQWVRRTPAGDVLTRATVRSGYITALDKKGLLHVFTLEGAPLATLLQGKCPTPGKSTYVGDLFTRADPRAPGSLALLTEGNLLKQYDSARRSWTGEVKLPPDLEIRQVAALWPDSFAAASGNAAATSAPPLPDAAPVASPPGQSAAAQAARFDSMMADGSSGSELHAFFVDTKSGVGYDQSMYLGGGAMEGTESDLLKAVQLPDEAVLIVNTHRLYRYRYTNAGFSEFAMPADWQSGWKIQSLIPWDKQVYLVSDQGGLWRMEGYEGKWETLTTQCDLLAFGKEAILGRMDGANWKAIVESRGEFKPLDILQGSSPYAREATWADSFSKSELLFVSGRALSIYNFENHNWSNQEIPAATIQQVERVGRSLLLATTTGVISISLDNLNSIDTALKGENVYWIAGRQDSSDRWILTSSLGTFDLYRYTGSLPQGQWNPERRFAKSTQFTGDLGAVRFARIQGDSSDLQIVDQSGFGAFYVPGTGEWRENNLPDSGGLTVLGQLADCKSTVLVANALGHETVLNRWSDRNRQWEAFSPRIPAEVRKILHGENDGLWIGTADNTIWECPLSGTATQMANRTAQIQSSPRTAPVLQKRLDTYAMERDQNQNLLDRDKNQVSGYEAQIGFDKGKLSQLPAQALANVTDDTTVAQAEIARVTPLVDPLKGEIAGLQRLLDEFRQQIEEQTKQARTVETQIREKQQRTREQEQKRDSLLEAIKSTKSKIEAIDTRDKELEDLLESLDSIAVTDRRTISVQDELSQLNAKMSAAREAIRGGVEDAYICSAKAKVARQTADFILRSLDRPIDYPKDLQGQKKWLADIETGINRMVEENLKVARELARDDLSTTRAAYLMGENTRLQGNLAFARKGKDLMQALIGEQELTALAEQALAKKAKGEEEIKNLTPKSNAVDALVQRYNRASAPKERARLEIQMDSWNHAKEQLDSEKARNQQPKEALIGDLETKQKELQSAETVSPIIEAEIKALKTTHDDLLGQVETLRTRSRTTETEKSAAELTLKQHTSDLDLLAGILDMRSKMAVLQTQAEEHERLRDLNDQLFALFNWSTYWQNASVADFAIQEGQGGTRLGVLTSAGYFQFILPPSGDTGAPTCEGRLKLPSGFTGDELHIEGSSILVGSGGTSQFRSRFDSDMKSPDDEGNWSQSSGIALPPRETKFSLRPFQSAVESSVLRYTPGDSTQPRGRFELKLPQRWAELGFEKGQFKIDSVDHCVLTDDSLLAFTQDGIAIRDLRSPKGSRYDEILPVSGWPGDYAQVGQLRRELHTLTLGGSQCFEWNGSSVQLISSPPPEVVYENADLGLSIRRSLQGLEWSPAATQVLSENGRFVFDEISEIGVSEQNGHLLSSMGVWTLGLNLDPARFRSFGKGGTNNKLHQIGGEDGYWTRDANPLRYQAGGQSGGSWQSFQPPAREYQQVAQTGPWVWEAKEDEHNLRVYLDPALEASKPARTMTDGQFDDDRFVGVDSLGPQALLATRNGLWTLNTDGARDYAGLIGKSVEEVRVDPQRVYAMTSDGVFSTGHAVPLTGAAWREATRIDAAPAMPSFQIGSVRFSLNQKELRLESLDSNIPVWDESAFSFDGVTDLEYHEGRLWTSTSRAGVIRYEMDGFLVGSEYHSRSQGGLESNSCTELALNGGNLFVRPVKGGDQVWDGEQWQVAVQGVKPGIRAQHLGIVWQRPDLFLPELQLVFKGNPIQRWYRKGKIAFDWVIGIGPSPNSNGEILWAGGAGFTRGELLPVTSKDSSTFFCGITDYREIRDFIPVDVLEREEVGICLRNDQKKTFSSTQGKWTEYEQNAFGTFLHAAPRLSPSPQGAGTLWTWQASAIDQSESQFPLTSQPLLPHPVFYQGLFSFDYAVSAAATQQDNLFYVQCPGQVILNRHVLSEEGEPRVEILEPLAPAQEATVDVATVGQDGLYSLSYRSLEDWKVWAFQRGQWTRDDSQAELFKRRIARLIPKPYGWEDWKAMDPFRVFPSPYLERHPSYPWFAAVDKGARFSFDVLERVAATQDSVYLGTRGGVVSYLKTPGGQFEMQSLLLQESPQADYAIRALADSADHLYAKVGKEVVEVGPDFLTKSGLTYDPFTTFLVRGTWKDSTFSIGVEQNLLVDQVPVAAGRFGLISPKRPVRNVVEFEPDRRQNLVWVLSKNQVYLIDGR